MFDTANLTILMLGVVARALLYGNCLFLGCYYAFCWVLSCGRALLWLWLSFVFRVLLSSCQAVAIRLLRFTGCF